MVEHSFLCTELRQWIEGIVLTFQVSEIKIKHSDSNHDLISKVKDEGVEVKSKETPASVLFPIIKHEIEEEEYNVSPIEGEQRLGLIVNGYKGSTDRCWKWLRFCGLEDRYRVASDVTYSLKICIEHFTESDYYRLPKMVRLHNTAVPTIHAKRIEAPSSPEIQSPPPSLPVPPVTLSADSTPNISHHETSTANEQAAELTSTPETIPSLKATPAVKIAVSRTYAGKAKSACRQGKSIISEQLRREQQLSPPFNVVPTDEVVTDFIKTEPDIDAFTLQNDNRNEEEQKSLFEEDNFLKVDVDQIQIKTEPPDLSYDLKSNIKYEEDEDPISFPVSNLGIEKELWYEQSVEEKPIPAFLEEGDDLNDRTMESHSKQDIRSQKIDASEETVQHSGVATHSETNIKETDQDFEVGDVPSVNLYC
ncbi:uncharacterized protein [Periplaneta americana]|uniref:uncharacterized protein isoform X3 n=1 Tax=Periplaneta americana TaxID=6978 RepID=UPI0037E738BC